MIRPATLEDLPALLAIGEDMAAESPRYSRLRFNRDKLAHMLRLLIEAESGFVRVVDDGCGVAAVMVAMVAEHWMSSDRHASDLALYVEPRARGTMAATELICAYRTWAQEQGAVLVQAGVTTGVFTEKTAQLYEHLGFKRCGVVLEA